MKKMILSILMVSIILIVLPKCKGSFDVQPRELYLSMDGKFINGNTSEILKVINTGDSEINISWYLDDPSPDLIRQNRTTIPDLSWIDLKPKLQLIPQHNSFDFFVYLNIPEDKNYMDKNWEVWITFKEEESGFIKFEHAVRFYIDTPRNIIENNNFRTFSTVVFIIIISIFCLIIVYFYKRKKQSRY